MSRDVGVSIVWAIICLMLVLDVCLHIVLHAFERHGF